MKTEVWGTVESMDNFHLIEDEVFLPEQNVHTRDFTGAQRLCLAILMDACQVVRRGPTARYPEMPTLYEDTLAWFEDPDRFWPFSFERCCEAVGFSTCHIRRLVKSGRIRYTYRDLRGKRHGQNAIDRTPLFRQNTVGDDVQIPA